jgi:hypothetical protein
MNEKMNLGQAIDRFDSERFDNLNLVRQYFALLSNAVGGKCKDVEKLKNLILMLANEIKGNIDKAKDTVLKELEDIKE